MKQIYNRPVRPAGRRVAGGHVPCPVENGPVPLETCIACPALVSYEARPYRTVHCRPAEAGRRAS